MGAANVTPGDDTERVTTAVIERTSTSTKSTVTRAYVYAIDPTPEQAKLLRSHIGGSRFAYNALLGLVKGNWDENRAKRESGVEVVEDDWVDTGHFGLNYLWSAHATSWRPGGRKTERAPTTPPPSGSPRPSPTGARAG
jgi:hypothetical protein